MKSIKLMLLGITMIISAIFLFEFLNSMNCFWGAFFVGIIIAPIGLIVVLVGFSQKD